MQFTLTTIVLAAAAVVHASPRPMPQAVTALLLPTDGTAPPGCMPTFVGTFGIAVHNISTAAMAKRQVAEATDGQPQAPTSTQPAVSQITDGQPQAMTVGHVSMITDGQIQAHFHTAILAPVAQITDGQIQAPKITMAPVTEFIDGQPQAPTITAPAVSQISDAQPQAPAASTSSASAVAQGPDAQPNAEPNPSTGSPDVTLVACQTDGTLELSLANGILKDSHGRTGYIASNYQFQFDDPPQSNALSTGGFSVCGNGSLALGGTTEFWQCRSGNFYNLYDRYWAAQCSPVTVNALKLITCG